MTTQTICNKCILPSTTPGISFDKEGICNYCNSYEPFKVKGERKFVEILNKFREENKNKKYDCMIGVSGGRDSTYILWKLVKDYNLRVLTVTYDNPFTSEQARKNIKKSHEILNLKNISWGFPNDIHRKNTKKALKVWSHNPSSKLISIVCAHCKTWWPGFFKVAHENDINLIIIGSNPFETASFKKKGFGGARSYHKLSNAPNIMTKTIKELIANPRYLTLSWKTIVRMYLGASHSTPYLRWRYKNISVLRFFDFINWNEKEVIDTITKNLGWKKSPEVASPWRFDCRLDYVRRLMYYSTVGVTELQDLFSKMIRTGAISREEALERFKIEGRVPKKVAEEVLAPLGLNLSSLNINIKENMLI